MTNIRLSEGTPKGERITLRRPIANATVEAGRTYQFVVSRLTTSPEDNLDQDIWFTGIQVKYWPETLTLLSDDGVFIYER